METRVRYVLYAGAAALAVAAYVGLDDTSETGQPAGPAQAAATHLALPELTSSSGNDNATVTRDLFRVVAPPPPPPVVVTAPEPPAAPPPPPPPDRLADLKIIGVVTRGPHLAILIEQGDEVTTVTSGQRFGKDEALSIDGIEANRVLVTDKLANVTKTFTLSEE